MRAHRAPLFLAVASLSLGGSILLACGSDDDDTSPTQGDAAATDSGSHDATTSDANVPPTPDGGTGPADGSTDGGAPLDGATDAAVTDGAADAALPAFVGVADFNLAHKCNADGPPADTYFFGFYQETPTDAGAGGTCQSTPINAACVYTTCTGQPSATTTLTAVPLNAGTVSIFEYEQDGGSDATDGGPVRVLNLDDAGYYTDPHGPILNTPSPGSVVVQGSGSTDDGGVGPFSLTIASPSILDVSLPNLEVDAGRVCGAPSTTAFALGSDLSVAWTNGVAGASLEVDVAVADQGADAGSVTTRTVSCTFDQGAGQGTVPSVGGLAHLSVDGGAVTGNVAVVNSSAAQVNVGAGQVRGRIGKFVSPPSYTFTAQ